jgi:hypothetical protein
MFAGVVGVLRQDKYRGFATHPQPNFEANGEPNCTLPGQYPFATIQMIA